jgi:cytoskeletal protein CcmA (bactofilin family)
MAFGFKKDKADSAEPIPLSIIRPEHPQPAQRRSAEGVAGSAVISPNLKFQGEITGDEDIVIDGNMDGKIRISRSLTVGNHGLVKGDIHSENVTVMGRVNGNIFAAQKVILKPTAKVTGNISCASFIVNEGAGFEGNINMKQLNKTSSSEPHPAVKTGPAAPAQAGQPGSTSKDPHRETPKEPAGQVPKGPSGEIPRDKPNQPQK